MITRDKALSYFSLIGAIPNPDKILRRTGKTIESYRDLKNDPHVWSCIQSRKSGLLSLEWELESRGSDGVADEVRAMLSDLDIHEIQRDMLEAPLFGFQPLELIWSISSNGRRLAPKALIAKPQEWFYFDNDSRLRFRQKDGSEGILPLPEKIINVSYEADYLNPYGQSLLSKCYWPVTFKNGGMRYWMTFVERYGMPFFIAQYQRGSTAEESQELLDSMKKMAGDSLFVAPMDVNFQIKEASKTSSSELFRELTKHCNAEISKAILSQTLTTELDMGSYAASMTHFKVRKEVVQSDARLIERAFNELIRHIVALNFPGKPCPLFKLIFREEEKEG
jgi:phage gp29-like protein